MGSGRTLRDLMQLWRTLWRSYGALGGPHGGPMGPGGTLGVSVAMGSERILWESAGLREDPMGPGGILWVLYGVWEDPMGVLRGMGEPYGSQRLWGLRES